MTDNQIKAYLEYIKDSRYGKGGFEVKLSQYDILYDDNAILSYFRGEYVNPIGPFRKWIYIGAIITTPDYYYKLSFNDKFWDRCSKYEFSTFYINNFLSILRQHYNGDFDSSDRESFHILGYNFAKDEVENHKKEQIISDINWHKSKI